MTFSDSWVDLSPSLFEGPSEAGELHHNSSEHLYYQDDDEHSDRDDDRKSEERSSTGGSSSSIEILQQSFRFLHFYLQLLIALWLFSREELYQFQANLPQQEFSEQIVFHQKHSVEGVKLKVFQIV